MFKIQGFWVLFSLEVNLSNVVCTPFQTRQISFLWMDGFDFALEIVSLSFDIVLLIGFLSSSLSPRKCLCVEAMKMLNLQVINKDSERGARTKAFSLSRHFHPSCTFSIPSTCTARRFPADNQGVETLKRFTYYLAVSRGLQSNTARPISTGLSEVMK